ncbi:longitudinals lacking protein, isoforms H/M/V-like [Trichoplusia ni]|uniref:Longitudinals lacking protein, isoforms H/M/V-like n=1 Tax=Trichoplusia ni TaxID=7111 RepID=A0A7E5VWQ2_TRINI|nr:longitudinals lacking protein, isoforms H/M/V-like [Trichoplusia ni]
MAQSQFSLLWNAHKRNICTGLSSLQQNGEFVDMTLAADGHHVKVHQVIIALASPYIKDLLASAQCPHPVIFLNKISYTTLCSLLEYIYTGEVLVSIENLSELLEAGKELHIKGLEDMKLAESISVNQPTENENDLDCNITMEDSESKFILTSMIDNDQPELSTNMDETYEEEEEDDDSMSQDVTTVFNKSETVNSSDNTKLSVMQFTVSNQGSLQMILNRYIYYLKHTNRNNTRQWRCVDYLNTIKCPAHVFTKDDVVVQRISAHVHPFHDKRILKKVRAGAVFSAIQEAEQQRKKKQATNSD